MLKYKVMFNQLIKLRGFPSFNSETSHLLFCNNSIDPPTPFRYNNYVSFNTGSKKKKKKQRINNKRKLVTSQKCKKSKQTCYLSLHHFWK